MSQNHPEAPPISNSRVKKLWKQKLARTEQELRIEKVEQMLDMMLVEKICKTGAPLPPTEPGRLDTCRGTGSVYLGENDLYAREEKK